MKEFTVDELNEILNKHRHWLSEGCDGWETMRADLRGAKNIPYIPMACTDTGCFIGWKKASGHIIKLFIPSDAKRYSATGRKCRCNKATVVVIENIDGTPTNILEVPSDYDCMFTYKLHGHVEVLDFDDDRFNECAPGIHFFVNRQEAVEY